MKTKDLIKQIEFGKLYEYKETNENVFYVIPVGFFEKNNMVNVYQLDKGIDGYITLKGFLGAYKLLGPEAKC